MAETITKQQQEAFIPSVIHNPNPSSQAICPPTGGDWKCDVCLKLMAQTAIPYSYSICLLFCPTFIFPWPHDKSCLIWNVLTDIQSNVFWI